LCICLSHLEVAAWDDFELDPDALESDVEDYAQ
jgi:hypothetical protein